MEIMEMLQKNKEKERKCTHSCALSVLVNSQLPFFLSFFLVPGEYMQISRCNIGKEKEKKEYI